MDVRIPINMRSLLQCEIHLDAMHCKDVVKNLILPGR